MNSPAPLRVVHVPGSVGGNPQGLSKHLRLLGVESQVWSLAPSPFGYPADRILWNAGDGLLRREWKRLRAIWAVARQFDVIHFNFGSTLAEAIPLRRDADVGLARKLKTAANAVYRRLLLRAELALYRWHGRPTFIHYQGDDARQGDFCLAHFRYTIARHAGHAYYCRPSDQFKRKMIRFMAGNCKQVYAVNPDLLHVLLPGARFIPYCHISLAQWSPVYPQVDENQPLRIGHAPSHRGVKGTDLVLAAVGQLRAEGYKFELDLVEGISHEEARKRYERIDIMVDQLHAGWYGGLAVEAMALGKPVLVYIRDEDLQFIPAQMRADLPFIRVTADSISEGLRQALSMPRSALLELGRKSRAYVERWHDPLRIAAEIKMDYENALASKGVA
ncbi:MAG: hypothetical protein JWR85_3873 [Marmoricola sp.]|nr:hypothetical protein [Marmoricola sp.]